MNFCRPSLKQILQLQEQEMRPEQKFVIFIPEPFPEQAHRILDDRFEVRQGRSGAPYTELEYKEILKDVDAIAITSRENISESVIRSAPSLRVIAKSGSRPENVDHSAASDCGVRVTWTPGANATSVAELTLTLILAAAKRLPEVSAHIRDGGWRSYDLLGTEIDGKVIGLIGLGAIGRAVASRVQALGCSVLGFDPFVTTEQAAAHGIQSVTFEELLERSDFVSVHCGLTPGTAKLIDRGALARMKDDAILINTARGGLVDEVALLNSLDAGEIRGAALDVFGSEPTEENHPLISHPRVIATPHIAAFTQEAILRETTRCLEDAARVLTGLAPLHMLQ
jgi:D-3-phosphoglycerate dehydrogenase / 2-oxoglutarate reductase